MGARSLLARRSRVPPALRPHSWESELDSGTLIVTEAQLLDLGLFFHRYPDADIDVAAYLADCADGRVSTHEREEVLCER